jgi:hypothetical protein
MTATGKPVPARKTRAAATLAEIRRWPAAVPVEDGARALNMSRASAYEAIARGVFPAKTIRVNRTLRVLTASLIDVLEGGSGGPALHASVQRGAIRRRGCGPPPHAGGEDEPPAGEAAGPAA